MTFFSALPVPETQIGLAKETKRGEPIAPAFWLPVDGPKYKPDIKLLPDEGLRGSMVTLYDEIPGLRNDAHGWDSYPYMDTLPLLLEACLGGKDHMTVAPTSTALKTEAAVGATKIVAKKTIAEGSYIVIGAEAPVEQETRLTKKVTEKGAEEFEVELEYPLSFAHVADATITGLTKHRFSLLNNDHSEGNQPPSFTITDYGGETNWRSLPGAQLNGFNISGAADTLPKVTVDWLSYMAKPPAEEPTASFSTVEAPPGWATQVAISGTQLGYVVMHEIDLKRNVKPIPAITGTQNYYQLFADAVEATAKVTVLEDPSATWLNAYENGDLEALDITIQDVQSGYVANFHSSKFKFVTGELDRSKEWVEVPLECQLIPSAEDALDGGVSPIVCTVANAHTEEY